MTPTGHPGPTQMAMILICSEFAVIGPVRAHRPHVFEVGDQREEFPFDFIGQFVDLFLDPAFVFDLKSH
jgi:hypothetical protein